MAISDVKPTNASDINSDKIASSSLSKYKNIKAPKKMVSYSKYGYFFILPFFAIYAIFSLYPLLNTIYLSMTQYVKPVMGPVIGPKFVGLSNFKDIVGNNRAFGEFTIGAFRNTFIMWSINFIPQISLALLLAAWFTNMRVKMNGAAQGIYKVMIYMPNIITAASISLLFKTLFSYPNGPINLLLQDIGILDDPFRFIETPTSAVLIISFINFWMWYGNTMIILIAGIMGINPSLYDSAEIDGANNGQIFRKITLPLLRPIMLYTLVTSLIGGMQMYDIPRLMAGDVNSTNPANRYIKTVTMYIQELVARPGVSRNYGHSAAVSVLLFLVTATFSIILFYIMRDKDAIKQRKLEKAAKKEAMANE